MSIYKMYNKPTYDELLHYFNKVDTVKEKDFWSTLIE